MKQIILVFLSVCALVCNGQDAKKDTFFLTVSPVINQQEPTNKIIIQSLTSFLKTKNSSLTENQYWLAADFNRFIYPYLDIYNIENSKRGTDFFKPTLMEIIPTATDTQRIIKIAFIGYDVTTKENQLKAVFNLVANIKNGEVKFSSYIDYATKNWQTKKTESISYKISERKLINESEIESQAKEIRKICKLLNTYPIPITYYSCVNPKEIFEIKGFDYTPVMYIDKTGGLADFGAIIFSGNNSEMYTHEIVHIYTNSLYPKIDKFLDEGIATYIAGSGKYNYKWHRNKLSKFLAENPGFNFTEHTDPYERLYYENETSIPYMYAALICERTKRIYGKDKLIEILASGNELWLNLKTVGLTIENINEELRKELKLQLTEIW